MISNCNSTRLEIDQIIWLDLHQAHKGSYRDDYYDTSVIKTTREERLNKDRDFWIISRSMEIMTKGGAVARDDH